MDNKILITGGTGLVGSHLTRLLLESNYDVAHLSRTSEADNIPTYTWGMLNEASDSSILNEINAIVHLAGSSVAEGRWTQKRRETILKSRIEPTRQLFRSMEVLDNRPKVFVAASAVGIYGFDTGGTLLDEDSPAGNDFLADVVKAWEAEVDKIAQLGIRVIKLRIGIVLAKEGGALPKITQPIKLGVGAPLGSGKQYMSWIHIDDLCKLVQWAIEQESVSGVFNAVGYGPATNEEFTKISAKKLKRTLLLPNLPAFAIKLMFGEMGNIVLGGNRVSNEKLLKSGFQFQYRSLSDALDNLLIES